MMSQAEFEETIRDANLGALADSEPLCSGLSSVRLGWSDYREVELDNYLADDLSIALKELNDDPDRRTSSVCIALDAIASALYDTHSCGLCGRRYAGRSDYEPDRDQPLLFEESQLEADRRNAKHGGRCCDECVPTIINRIRGERIAAEYPRAKGYRLVNAETGEVIGVYPWVRTAVRVALARFPGFADFWNVYDNFGYIVASGSGRYADATPDTPPEHPFLPLRLLQRAAQRAARRSLARGIDEALR